MTMKMKPTIGVVVALSMLLMAASAQAATITWGPVTNVDYGDTTQILGRSVDYSYVEAVTCYTNAALTINGVMFLPRANPDVYMTNATYSGATHISQAIPGVYNNDPDNNTSDQNMPINTNLGDDYHRLLGTFGQLSYLGTDGVITLAGLTIGRTYRVQLWAGVWDNRAYDTTYDTVSLHCERRFEMTLLPPVRKVRFLLCAP